MRIVKVISSNIDNLIYNEEIQVLEIEYKKGIAYMYFDVPLIVFDRFVKAESKGKFFHSEIKDKYEFEKL